MTTDEIISRCYEHGQPDYVLAADRLKLLQAECKSLREANETWVAIYGPRDESDLNTPDTHMTAKFDT